MVDKFVVVSALLKAVLLKALTLSKSLGIIVFDPFIHWDSPVNVGLIWTYDIITIIDHLQYIPLILFLNSNIMLVK